MGNLNTKYRSPPPTLGCRAVQVTLHLQTELFRSYALPVLHNLSIGKCRREKFHIFIGLLQVFHVESGAQTEFLTEPFIRSLSVVCFNSVDHDSVKL